MPQPVDSLTSLRAFVAAADTRSFRIAGQQLGVSSSAVGKAIARLESQLGTSLFHRTTRTISLTDAGNAFLMRVRRILDELRDGENELAEASGIPRGRLRVSLPVIGSLLTDALAAFVAAYPLVELDLDFTDRIVDIIDEGFDLVVRTGDNRDSRLMHKTLGRFGWSLVASPTYLAIHGSPATPLDLTRHVCLRQKFPSGRIGPWSFRSAPETTAPISLSTSVIDPLYALAMAGGGIAAFPDFLVRDAIAEGALVPVLEGELEQTGVLNILWPGSRFPSPKVRAFVDTFSKHVGQQMEIR
jgi:DNA-binding transcriptional LysR family regulator